MGVHLQNWANGCGTTNSFPAAQPSFHSFCVVLTTSVVVAPPAGVQADAPSAAAAVAPLPRVPVPGSRGATGTSSSYQTAVAPPEPWGRGWRGHTGSPMAGPVAGLLTKKATTQTKADDVGFQPGGGVVRQGLRKTATDGGHFLATFGHVLPLLVFFLSIFWPFLGIFKPFLANFGQLLAIFGHFSQCLTLQFESFF